MRHETMIIRDILKYYYPETRFLLKFKNARDYTTTADKIIVTICDDTASIKEVIETLKKYTIHIHVAEKGEFHFTTERPPYLLQIGSYIKHDADELRLIIVEKKKGVKKSGRKTIND